MHSLFNFGSFFDNNEGPPVGEHYETDGKHYFILMRVKAFMGTFLAVEVDGPDDKQVFGKPVHLILHHPTRDKERVEQAEKAASLQAWERRRHTTAFLHKARERSPLEWNKVVPRYSDTLERHLCTQSCPGQYGRALELPYDEVLEALCEHHREMVDCYLAEHPDAWPPKP